MRADPTGSTGMAMLDGVYFVQMEADGRPVGVQKVVRR